MSATLRYTFCIELPDQIDAILWAEIIQDAEPHDDTDAKVIARWLGDIISAVEDDCADMLPDGCLLFSLFRGGF